ncbi:helix-turn-helix domain-containing protein [Pseudomonas sp. BGI-2]|uniref:helix-turn-helix domain-containing protein n=1 Tax=Pseudomonas sp. BGI-2 TaxID=2528211 RepID=UPI00103394B1|nr:helix-turn-helix domain-containing protein [Pseudomonas sp. BGI-2]TBN46711.1 DNA-binding protein [Pseudomonas sp. BGI-2]
MSLNNPITPLSVGVDDGARLIGVARSMFYEILARREIESFKLGRRRLVLVKNLEAFINRQAKENSR